MQKPKHHNLGVIFLLIFLLEPLKILAYQQPVNQNLETTSILAQSNRSSSSWFKLTSRDRTWSIDFPEQPQDYSRGNLPMYGALTDSEDINLLLFIFYKVPGVSFRRSLEIGIGVNANKGFLLIESKPITLGKRTGVQNVYVNQQTNMQHIERYYEMDNYDLQQSVFVNRSKKRQLQPIINQYFASLRLN